MTYLKVTGMVAPEAGSYWSEGTLEIWPADKANLDWADGARRAIWPITGTLAGAGTRWGSTGEAGDVYVPGADIGNSVEPPTLEIIAKLKDGARGEWKEFRAVGKVQATAPGEWNINSPLKAAMQYVNTPGVPAGALTAADIGVSVPSLAQNAAKADGLDLRVARATRPFFTLPTDPDIARRVLLTPTLADLGAALTPFGTGVYIEGDQQVRIRCNQRIAAGTFHVIEIGFGTLEQNGPLGTNLVAAQALNENDELLFSDQATTYNYLDIRPVGATGVSYRVHTYVKDWNAPGENNVHRFDPYGTKFDLILLLNSGGHYANKQIITHCRIYAAKEGDIVESTVESGWRVNKYAGGWKHSFLPGGGQSIWDAWSPA